MSSNIRLVSLSINKLFGLNYLLEFNPTVTILHGRNGSGKTTILNIIHNICRGNIKGIIAYNFDHLHIEYVHEHINYDLIIHKEGNDYNVSLNEIKAVYPNRDELLEKVITQYSIDGEEINDIDFIINKSEEVRDLYNKNRKRLRYSYRRRENNQKNIEDLLEKHFSHLYIPVSREAFYKNSYNEIKNKNGDLDNALLKTISLIEQIKNSINEEENEIFFKTQGQIFKELLRSPYEETKPSGTRELNTYEVKQLEKYGIDQFVSYSIWDNRDNKANNFVKDAVRLFQIESVIKMLDIINKNHKSVESKKSKLNELEETLNNFFYDSDKQINIVDTISLKNSQFKKNEINKEKIQIFNTSTKESIEFKQLSAGEKQLFIIISLVSLKNVQEFNKNSYNRFSNKITLIDEPELSLHVEWQSNLLKALTKGDSNQQLIIATHSPEIIGDYGTGEFVKKVRGTFDEL